MKIITFNAIKGGVGKTTLSYNFGEYLAKQNKKVLLIDLDFQRNLTELYLDKTDEDTLKGSAKNIFKEDKDVIFHHVKDNIDLIAGASTFDDVKIELGNNPSRNMCLYFKLSDWQEQGKLNYDYIIIDTRPEFDFIVDNAVIASHVILSPITPDLFGRNARYDESARLEISRKENIDPQRNSLVTAKLFLIGNKITNTTLSKRFMEESKQDEEVIENIPQRELFNKSTDLPMSLAEMEESPKFNRYKDFLKEMDKKWSNVQKVIDNL